MNNDYENQENNVIGNNENNKEATKEDISFAPLFAESENSDSMPISEVNPENTEENTVLLEDEFEVTDEKLSEDFLATPEATVTVNVTENQHEAPSGEALNNSRYDVFKDDKSGTYVYFDRPMPDTSKKKGKKKRSVGATLFLTCIFTLLTLFSIGFFVLCGYILSISGNYFLQNVPPTSDAPQATTAPEEDYTFPDSGTVQGGVIPSDDNENPYSSDNKINLLGLPKDKDNSDKYTTQYAFNIISDSTVGIVGYEGTVTENSQPASQGTGIILSSDGYVVTNSHVIGDSRNLYKFRVVLNDGTAYEAKVIGYDSRTDLAVLKISASNLTPAVFGDSELVEIGQDVIAVGNPGGLDFQNSLTKGIISAKDRELSLSASVSYFQTDAAINPGNSGGPLCNMYGQVIGINTAKISADAYEGMGFSIPSRTVKEIVDDLIANGYVADRVRIGISGQPVTEAMMQYYGLPAGILVGEISEDGPCAGTELKIDDVITAIDNEAVENFSDVYSILAKHKAGDRITLSVYRSSNKSEFSVKVTLMADKGETQQ